ncbi:hypothetical protein [Tepidimicrobium xylanilyticum]|uniref:Putative ABC transport system permease protein n=1 Tax=Tepidimicrobium xylanilyticum TaxID=1123352 RepID=A0A1H3DD90_9FIRM|nr:hypothetical protein [Tepidimicrobium xylanilyticum]SDX64385.1 putative ABC transport system permease protein [Tepidimicrobium xylanilyticum]
MKRILNLLMLILGTLFLFIIIEFSELHYVNKLMYKNSSAFTLICDQSIHSEEEILYHLNKISEEENIYLAKYTMVNSDDIYIYSTDTTLDGKVSLSSGKFPQDGSETYICDKYYDAPNQIGTFKAFLKEDTIRIYPINNLSKVGGYGGLYYIGTTDQEILNRVVEYLNNYLGKTEIFEVYNPNLLEYFLDILSENFMLIGFTALLFVVLFIFSCIRFAISQCKNITILKLWGYSVRRIFLFYLEGFKFSILLNFGILSMGVTIYLKSIGRVNYLSEFLFAIMLFLGIMLLFLLVVVLLVSSFQGKYYSKYELLKNRKTFNIVYKLQLALKCIILIFIIFIFTFSKEINDKLNKFYYGNEYWSYAENIYGTRAWFLTEDPVAFREYELKSKEFYRELEDEMNMFFIRAFNYHKLSSGVYIYDANTDGEIELLSPSGKSIMVNENYLKRHPIKDIHGEDVVNRIIKDELIQNILVPISLKEHEDFIKDKFIEGFYFLKVRVADIYNEKMNMPPEETKIEDLDINIIYVPDNLRYFTYDPDVEGEYGNCVENPIVVIDTLNLDPSNYYSYLTNCCYIEGDIKSTEKFISISEKYGLTNIFNTLSPIYDLRAEEIRNLRNLTRITEILQFILIIGFGVSTILFNLSYYESKKYKLYLKYLFGYSFARRSMHVILINTAAIGIILTYYSVPFIFMLLILLADLLAMILLSALISRKSISYMMKGGH